MIVRSVQKLRYPYLQVHLSAQNQKKIQSAVAVGDFRPTNWENGLQLNPRRHHESERQINTWTSVFRCQWYNSAHKTKEISEALLQSFNFWLNSLTNGLEPDHRARRHPVPHLKSVEKSANGPNGAYYTKWTHRLSHHPTWTRNLVKFRCERTRSCRHCCDRGRP